MDDLDPASAQEQPAITRDFCRTGEAARRGRRVLGEARSALACDGVALWVFSADGRKLEGALNAGSTAQGKSDRPDLPDRLEHVDVPIDSALVGLVSMTGEGICVGPDGRFNPDVAKAIEMRTYAMVATPMWVDGAIAGVVSAVNLVGGREQLFSAEHLEILKWKAYLLGLVIEDCRDGD